jgi:pimeloyl-ACP methyl ester carboxylesterase
MNGTQSTVATAAAALLFMAAGCDGTEPVATFLPASVASKTVVGEGFTRVEGERAGARFALIRPDDWNGDLVVLLHGRVPPEAPLSLEPPLHWWFAPVVDELVAQGFGVAFSSYRTNGHAVREGALDSRIAQAMFTAEFGTPGDTYLLGWSMGALIGQLLVETAPERYAGFLAVCGPLGGASLQHDYAANARVLFDYFYPGVLPGNVLTSDLSFFDDVLPSVVPAIMSDPMRAVAFTRMDQLDIRWADPEELVPAVAASLFLAGGGTRDLQLKARGNPFDNTQTVYTGDLLGDDALQALNALIERFRADPQAARYLDRYYQPSGEVRATPILALHTARDPINPAHLHLPAYRQLLDATGNADFFVSRVVDGFGHCEFGVDMQPDGFLDIQLGAFASLVAWVRTGMRPAP